MEVSHSINDLNLIIKMRNIPPRKFLNVPVSGKIICKNIVKVSEKNKKTYGTICFTINYYKEDNLIISNEYIGMTDEQQKIIIQMCEKFIMKLYKKTAWSDFIQ